MENNKKVLKLGFDLDGVILLWLFFILKEAREVLSSLREQGHIVKVVTARGKPWTLWHARTILKIYGLGWIEVIGVGRNGDKWKVLKGFDLYIDNKSRHLLDIVKYLAGSDRIEHLFIFSKKPQPIFKNLENWPQIHFVIGFLEESQEKELVV